MGRMELMGRISPIRLISPISPMAVTEYNPKPLLPLSGDTDSEISPSSHTLGSLLRSKYGPSGREAQRHRLPLGPSEIHRTGKCGVLQRIDRREIRGWHLLL